MADNIDALLGLVSDPNTDTAALANQLRGQRDMGNFYGLSTIDQVAGYGKNLRDTALATADKTGTRRTAAEKEAFNRLTAAEQKKYTRAYAARRDTREAFESARTHNWRVSESKLKRAREATQDAEALKKLTGPTQYHNPDSDDPQDVINVYKNAAGKPVDEDGRPLSLDGLVQFSPSDEREAFESARTHNWRVSQAKRRETREATQDAEALKADLLAETALGAPKAYRDPQTNETVYVQFDSQGRAYDQGTQAPVDLSGMVEVQRGGYRSNRGERDAYGNKKHLIDGEYWLVGAGPNGENVPYSLAASREIAGDVADADAAAAGGKKFSKETGKLVAQQMPAAIDHRGALRKQRASLGQALDALEGGAWSGTLINKFTPILREATSRLRNAQERLGLGEIGNYVFGSLSTAEGNWLKETSLDLNQKPEQLMSDVRHRIEVVDRMEDVSRYVMRELKKGKYPEQAEIDDILHAGGFTLHAPMLGADGKASAAPAPAPPATAAQWANMNEDMRARWLTAGRSAPSVGK